MINPLAFGWPRSAGSMASDIAKVEKVRRSIGTIRHRSKRPPYPSKRPFTIDRRLARSSRLLDQVHHDAAKSNRAALRVLEFVTLHSLETSDRRSNS
jgi:hypothetical protein